MKRLTGNHLYMKSLLLGSLSLIVSQTITLAEPIVPATDGTGTQVEINGNEFNITGGKISGDRANLFHSFQEFSLNSGQIATFQSNPEILNILSRVTGGNPSMINGLIQVTGGNANLFLINPAGIVFGSNASLNIPADFIATTASGVGFNQGWFDAFGNNNWAELIGSPSVFRFDGNGAIVNFGNLNISNGHQLGLLGSSVLNLGSLSAPGGNIIITAVPGESLVKLSQPGHLLSLEISPNSLDTITPSNLPELLTGGQVHDATQVVVHDDGTIQLTGSGVSVPTDTGVTIVSGNIDVSNNAAGTVAVLGEKVALVDANINASGNNTGGNVFIGGNFQGQGNLPNAAHTFVNNNSSISVNALENGNAGSAIAWADETTRFHGNISATGGNFGGNGGLVEVSGKQNLIFRGFVDVTANQGNPGTILFDPKNITIADGGADNIDLNNAFNENPTADVTFDADNITGLSGDVILEANNDITVDEPIILNSFSFIDNLELRAGRSININAHITTYTTGANIILTGNDNRADVNNRDSGPANISAIAGLNGGDIDITLGTLGESGKIALATVTTQRGKHINITNTNNGYGGDIEISEPMSSSSGSNGGSINLIADGNILTNNINSFGQEGRGGNINFTSNNGAIETGELNSSGLFDGGAIALNAEGNILTNNINSFGQEGRGGNINFTSNNGAIETGELNSSGLFDGGAIALNAEGNIVAGGVDSYGIPIPGNIYSGSYDSGTGGSINLHSASGFINTNDGYLNSIANQENGGDITLTAQGNINTGYISSYSQEATAGTIKLTSNNAAIETGDIDSASNQGNGNSITLNAEGNILTNVIYSFGAEGRGGNIHLTSNNGAIETGDLNSSGLFDGGAIALNAEENIVLAGLDQNENLIPGNGNISSDSAGSGTGGDISLRSNSGVINLGSIDASANQGNGGDITLTAEGNINTGYISSYSQEATAGTINVTSNNAAIETGELNSSSNQGNGNSITLNADDDILITSNIYSDSAGSGTGGDISLTSGNGAINIIEGNIESSSNEGDGGNIELTAKGDIRTNNIDSYSNGSGTAGNIKLTSTSGLIDILGSLTSASLNGIGGSIALTADEIDWTEAIVTSNGGILLLQPATNTQSIEIGGNNESPSLDLSTTELQLIDGFDSLTIGRTGDTGIINIAGLVNLSNENFDLTISGGSLSFNNGITIRNNGILTVNTGSITSPFDGTDIAIGGNGTLVLNVSGNVGELLNPLVTKVSELDIDNVTGNVFLNNITSQNFNLGKTNVTGDLTITNDGNITDIGVVNISGNSSFTTTGNDATITLDQLSITGPVSLNTTGSNAHVNITNATGLNLADSQVGGNLNIATTTGKISDSGTVIVNGNSNFTTLENGAGINLDQLAATGAINVNTNGVGADVIITNDTAVNLGNSNIGGSLNATANNSNIITSGNINAESDINLTGQAIALNNSITSGGSLNATASGNISNSGEINAESDIKLIGNNITLNNSITSGGNLTATANNGEIYNSGEINAGADITLTGNTISLKNSLTSPGNLILQPFNPNTTIDIGGETETFNLSAAEIANLSDGFSSITIGRSDGTGMVNLGNISFSDPVTMRSPNGAIAVNGIITGTDNASVNLSSNHITLNSGIITNNQNILINGNTILGNDITLDSGTGLGNILFTGTIDGNQKLTLNAGNGTIAFTGAIGTTTALNGLITNSIINSGLEATANTIQLNRDITTTGANVILNAQNQLTTNNITTNGGKISLSNRQGDITAGNLDSSNLEAVGGAIAVNSPTGILTTGNLISTGTTGGDITAIAKTTITTGDINTSGTVGNAGNVLLDPENDIQVGFINAQGGASGSGGNVDISTGHFFRSTNSFTDQNGQIASISTAGGNGSGSISISHDGGSQNIPFVVGDASTNGTAGVITTSADNTIPLGSILPGPVEQGDIHIQTPMVPVAPAPADDTSVSPQLEPEPQAKPIQSPSIPIIDIDVIEPPVAPPVGEPVGPTPSPPALPVKPPGLPVNSSSSEVNSSSSEVNSSSSEVNSSSSEVNSSPPPPPPPPTVAILDPKIVDPEEAAIAIDIPNNSEEEEDLLDPEKISQPDKVAILDPGMGAIEQAFSQRFNDYIGEVNSPATTTLAEAQNIIQQIESETGVKPALVYVCFGFTSRSGISDNDPLELILVTGNGHPIKKSLSATRGEAIATANKFIDYITSPRYRRQTKYLAVGQQLYQWLIAPLKEELDLQGIENIAFIMDQGLRALPVAAIHDGEHFLVEKYSLGLMPSLSLTDTRYQNIQNASVLGMGSSEFSELNSLPAVPAEVQTITQQIRHGDSFMNEEFTLNNIQAQYADKQYPIVHMATHGEFEPGEISNSYIQLWDQKLHLDDIRQLGFTNPPVELLVLSACRTAIGSPEAELGFAGLALQAGVKTAIASLWYVSDEGTFGLMTEFYNQLSIAPIKAEAMRQAQLSMINGNVEVVDGQLRGSRGSYPLPESLQNVENQKLTHPYYWSAFTLIGSPW